MEQHNNGNINQAPPHSPYETPTVQSYQIEQSSEMENKKKQWMLFCHLSPFANSIFPFGGIIACIVIWQMQKDELPEIVEEAKEALNFQLTYLIAGIACVPLFFILIGIPLIIVLAIASLVLTILAIIESAKGAPYRYPFILRMVR